MWRADPAATMRNCLKVQMAHTSCKMNIIWGWVWHARHIESDITPSVIRRIRFTPTNISYHHHAKQGCQTYTSPYALKQRIKYHYFFLLEYYGNIRDAHLRAVAQKVREGRTLWLPPGNPHCGTTLKINTQMMFSNCGRLSAELKQYQWGKGNESWMALFTVVSCSHITSKFQHKHPLRACKSRNY